MTDQHAAFVGSIPEHYDKYLGPALFEPYASDLAEHVKVAPGASVLEIGCGTGILTRILRDRLAQSVKLVATDLNPAMMEFAVKKFAAAENVEFKQADAADLPFVENSFDAVVCQFGFMFVSDKEKAFREVRRVIIPNGQFCFNLWDALELNELAWIAHTTIKRFFDQNPPAFYEIPFSMHDSEEVLALLEAVGFREIDISLLKLRSVSHSASEVAKGLIRGNPVIAAIEERANASPTEIEQVVAAEVAARCGDFPVQARMQAFVFKCVG